jgi:hypothetical protein
LKVIYIKEVLQEIPMKRGHKTPDMKIEVVQGRELTEQEVEEVAQLLASWIIRDYEKRIIPVQP